MILNFFYFNNKFEEYKFEFKHKLPKSKDSSLRKSKIQTYLFTFNRLNSDSKEHF